MGCREISFAHITGNFRKYILVVVTVGSPSPNAVLGPCSCLSVDKPSPCAGPDECKLSRPPPAPWIPAQWGHLPSSCGRRALRKALIGPAWDICPSLHNTWLARFGFISHPKPAARSSEGAVRPFQLLQTRLAPGRRHSCGTVREGAVWTDGRSRRCLYRFSEKSNLRTAQSYHWENGDLLCVSNRHIRILGSGLWFTLWRNTDWLKPRVHYVTLKRIQVSFRSINDFKVFVILPSWKKTCIHALLFVELAALLLSSIHLRILGLWGFWTKLLI